jgi:hypothetical protein
MLFAVPASILWEQERMKIEKKLERSGIIFSDILKFETDTTYFLNPSVHASKTFVKVEIHNR